MAEWFLKQPPEVRRDALGAVAEAAGRLDYLLEKDVWVVQTLDVLFTARFAKDLAFKGGTSLSKAYGAIDRFSEDVDLTYDIRELAADLADPNVLTKPSKSKARKLTEQIRGELLPRLIQADVVPALELGFAAYGLDAAMRIEGCDVFVEYDPAGRARPAPHQCLGRRRAARHCQCRCRG